jgi:hypothetical protein
MNSRSKIPRHMVYSSNKYVSTKWHRLTVSGVVYYTCIWVIPPHPRYNFCQDEPGSEDHLTWSEIDRINKRNQIKVSTQTELDSLVQTATDSLSSAMTDRKACVVSDRWMFVKNMTRLHVNDLPYKQMKQTLARRDWTTDEMMKSYDCSTHCPDLADLLISPRAFELVDGETYVWFGNSLLDFLHNVDTENMETLQHPPKYAIADLLLAPRLELFNTATNIDVQMVALAQLRGAINVIHGGPKNELKSHILVWDNRNA